MATLYRRGKTWWVYTCTNGKRRRWSLGTTDERVAPQKLRKLEYEQATGELELPSITPIDSFLQAFCEYLETARTGKGYKNDISYLRTVFGPTCEGLKLASTLNRRYKAKRQIKVRDRLAERHVQVSTLEEPTAGMIDEHIIRRIRLDRISPKTANRAREVLHVMFNYAIRQHGFRSRDQRFPNPVPDARAHRQPAGRACGLPHPASDRRHLHLRRPPAVRGDLAHTRGRGSEGWHDPGMSEDSWWRDVVAEDPAEPSGADFIRVA
jgi:hypothetical protein